MTKTDSGQDALLARLSTVAGQVEAQLESLLVDTAGMGEVVRPPLLMEAMRYTVLGGGKRIRPFLVVESANILGLESAAIPAFNAGPLRAGAALELLHCYSLVHDDLPAMDDDDLRRGKPTVHRAYDEAMAVLVGDALLTLAFDVLVDAHTARRVGLQNALVRILARAAGAGGMVGGQMLDLAAEGRYQGKVPSARDEAAVITIQSMKTGALIRAACQMGAVLGGGNSSRMKALETYGTCLGLAFQIKDDLLDIESDAATIGKATGKDAAAGKATFVSLLGVEGARQRLAQVSASGKAALKSFRERGETLCALLDFNQTRTS